MLHIGQCATLNCPPGCIRSSYLMRFNSICEASKTRTVKRQDRDDCPGNRCSCRLSDDHGRLYRLSTCTSSLCTCATLCVRALLERGTRLFRGSGRCDLERRSIHRHDPRPSRRHRIDRQSAHAGRRQRASSVQQGRCQHSGSSIDGNGSHDHSMHEWDGNRCFHALRSLRADKYISASLHDRSIPALHRRDAPVVAEYAQCRRIEHEVTSRWSGQSKPPGRQDS